MKPSWMHRPWDSITGGAAVIRYSGSKGFHMDCPKAEGVRKTESRNRRRAGPAHRKRADE